METPAQTSWRASKEAVRSTTFLSAFVGIFQVAHFSGGILWIFLAHKFDFALDLQAVICLHRKVASQDHKLVYWLSGGLAALSVLFERKSRRSELALYVLPRAGDSLWYILVNRHLLPNIKNAEVIFNL